MQYGDLLIRLKNSRKCCKLYYDATTPEKKSACHDPNNFLDSILALDIEKGDVKWQPQSGITWSLNAATGEIIWLVASRPGNRDGVENDISYHNRTVEEKSKSRSITYGGAIVAIDIITDWLSFGGTGENNINNNRNSDAEKIISPKNVGSLKVKFIIPVESSVSATPVTFQNNVYFPDWAGFLYSANARTGEINWKINITKTYLPQPSDPRAISRTTLAIDPKEKLIVFGTQNISGGSGFVIAIDLYGKLVWRTLIDEHPYAVITQSPTIFDNAVYIGVSSAEEGAASTVPGYVCCSFRGSFAKLDLKTGKVIWRTFMVPDNYGRPDLYSGNAVWGSAPAIDPIKKLVYIATGNNYEIPENVTNCITNATTPEQKSACHDPNNFLDAILALDIEKGDVKWVTRLSSFDSWTVACLSGTNPQNCPDPAGPDYDFAQAPLLVNACSKSNDCILLAIATAKSGITWALNAATGKIIWFVESGPGGVGVDLNNNIFRDGKHYFVSQSNSRGKAYVFTKPSPKSQPATFGGAIVSIDILTGEILWQTANPTQDKGVAPVSYSNGVVWYGSNDDNGHLFALDAENGNILLDFVTGGTVACGPSIVNGIVYAGSGYVRFGGGVNNTKVFALSH
ncbi:Quino protein alcohol dehydrogenase-like protein [Rhizophagus irregularis]|uniref:Quino protein alcohol dehydrogenase-like protein n=1 Tax=Rhizophagus irregularis TaxID=588596 RepID=A0A2N0P638_9GLOM|nr:Quino protein alcohol dehydrogenase-like protein [Rhizophagus irregularis]